MDNSDLKKFQERLFDMLIEVDKIFVENGINYFLVGGSVLGAIRHRGFIPWDDDIDLGFFAEDFEKMEKIIQEKLPSNLIYCKIGENRIQNAPIGYLYDISDKNSNLEEVPTIDFFRIDNIPKNRCMKEIQRIASLVYHLCIYRRPSKNRGKKAYYFTKIILTITPKFVLDFSEKISYKVFTYWNKKESKEVANIYGQKKYYKEIMPKEYIGNPVFKEFENRVLPIPEKYHEYLTHLYGDYMKLPPEEDRKSQHKNF